MHVCVCILDRLPAVLQKDMEAEVGDWETFCDRSLPWGVRDTLWYVCMYVCMCVCVCLYMDILCTYTYAYTYIHGRVIKRYWVVFWSRRLPRRTLQVRDEVDMYCKRTEQAHTQWTKEDVYVLFILCVVYCVISYVYVMSMRLFICKHV